MTQSQHVKVVGLPNSKEAYAIRDFLKRGVVG